MSFRTCSSSATCGIDWKLILTPFFCRGIVGLVYPHSFDRHGSHALAWFMSNGRVEELRTVLPARGHSAFARQNVPPSRGYRALAPFYGVVNVAVTALSASMVMVTVVAVPVAPPLHAENDFPAAEVAVSCTISPCR